MCKQKLMGWLAACLLAGVVVLGGVGCGRQAPDHHYLVGTVVAVTTTTTVPVTTTTVPPTTTTVVQPPPQATGGTRVATVAHVAGMPSDAFWYALSHHCESSTGGGGNGGGWFQFSGDTAKVVGYAGGSYETQLAQAKSWLAHIGVANGGTRSGWPVCWWRAKAEVGW